ncbi:bifunctional glycoside hydrolase 114/ polysaccharide deacetylase family protein [Ralstonia sp. SET104]|uniref:bifunctional glycoside hydrolase 114/ polysaccharide deacetylase family protein n=1 Tax=Ralstonia sp. SET104 TaxID=2448774 RepID=UPI0021A982F2|nr:bifunctional glycoside hydrolase 114/ polysaccharide deacetylase family protein [Ralstonia sp. SET104]
MRHPEGKRGNTKQAGAIGRVAALLAAALLSTPWMALAQQTAGASGSTPSASISAPNIAWYYGDKPPVGQLRAFDAVVVEPDHGFDPSQLKTPSTQWFAYVSLGEVTPERGWFKALPKAWLLGDNAAWASRVVDQAQPDWPAFYVEHVIKPLWDKGYRGFFLDTLDSYQLVAKDDASRAAQEAGMVRVIRAVKARYPEARLIFNRGFEILPQVHDQAYAVAFESLYRGWDQGAKQYKEVNDADRAWLMGQARKIRDEYHLPVISIDYCPPADRACARETAKRIKAQGLIPYVTDPALSTIGVGRIEVLPRKVLILQERDLRYAIDTSDGVRFVAMPLNFLGYDVEYADINKPLPAEVPPDRYAGVVVWVNSGAVNHVAALTSWVRQRMRDGVRIAFMNQFGLPADASMANLLKLKLVQGRATAPLEVVSQDKIMGFEMAPRPDRREAQPIQVGANGQSLLRLKSGNFEFDAAAITDWGGYVLNPYAVFSMDKIEQARWVVQPMEFLRRALALPNMPIPDLTSENGRRLMLVHVDGDGFASRAEFPGPGEYSGEVLLQEIWDKYRIPTTLSVIEGEVGATGLYPKLTPRLEAIARKMFALPYVELGSHTYSHPFDWSRTVQSPTTGGPGKDAGGGDTAFTLTIPGYKFSLDREIAGSIHYIDERLAPPGKRVKILQWSGDCQPPERAVRMAWDAGVVNINGGDTTIRRNSPSWTSIASIGIDKGPGAYQVFAPNQNENVYTNDWAGPYYGFERLIETLQMTDTPYRFKPINLYYHMYSGTKLASLKALKKDYDYALSQPVFPIYATQYVAKVMDFRDMAVARDGDDWIVRGNGDLRELRWMAPGTPRLADAQGVVGYDKAAGGIYIHMDDGAARFAMPPAAEPAKVPYIAEAAAFVRDFTRNSNGLSFEAGGYYKPFVRLANVGACRVMVNGAQGRAARAQGDTVRVDLNGVAAQTVTYQRIDVVC